MTASDNRDTPVKGTALVVDDIAPNRKILQVLLKHEGYETLHAENGKEAVEMYLAHHPDIIFMDVMMPEMDGFQATSRIKELAGNHFVPVIFLTALTESDALVKCIAAGGDDFFSKPFKREILSAKIRALERIRDLTRIVEAQKEQVLKEQSLAQQIYNRAVTADNIASKYINSLLRPVSLFSGDMLLTADCPNGNMHVLLGDFTGHGLVASLGVLPAAEAFRTMTAKGLSAEEILLTISAKLNRLLPTGMFLAASFLEISADMRSASIWNAGMPEILVLRAENGERPYRVYERIISRSLPLGIMPQMDLSQAVQKIDLCSGDRILMCSDGLSEAINSLGEPFGLARYEQYALSTKNCFTAVVSAVEAFRGVQPFRDDVSFVEVQCEPGLLKQSVQR